MVNAKCEWKSVHTIVILYAYKFQCIKIKLNFAGANWVFRNLIAFDFKCKLRNNNLHMHANTPTHA